MTELKQKADEAREALRQAVSTAESAAHPLSGSMARKEAREAFQEAMDAIDALAAPPAPSDQGEAVVAAAILQLKPAAPEALLMQGDQPQKWYRLGFEHAKELAACLAAATPTAAPAVAAGEVSEPNIPGLDADPSAFVRWASKAGYDMECHPLHFLFLNERTAAAREGWKASRDHYAALATPSPSGAPAQALTGRQEDKLMQLVATACKSYLSWQIFEACWQDRNTPPEQRAENYREHCAVRDKWHADMETIRAALRTQAAQPVDGEALPTAEMNDAGLAALRERHKRWQMVGQLDWRDIEAIYLAMRAALTPSPQGEQPQPTTAKD